MICVICMICYDLAHVAGWDTYNLHGLARKINKHTPRCEHSDRTSVAAETLLVLQSPS